MYDSLFGSRTRVKLLTLLLTNPNQAYYVREITRKIEEQINSVRRELINLKSIGLVRSHEKRGKIYFQANPKFEYFPELKKMFEKASKKMGEQDRLAFSLRRVGDVQYAALLGSFVGDHYSQVDLFLVGEIDKRKLKPILNELEKEIGREVNFCIMTEAEYEDRSLLFDRFLMEIMSKEKTIVIDYLKSEPTPESEE